MKKELEDSQAKKLQQLFEEVTNNEVTEENEIKEADGLLEAEREQEVSELETATNQTPLTEEVIENEQTEAEQEEVETADVSNKVVQATTEAPREIKFAYEEMDVLNLPPRSEVHSQSKTRLSLSLKKPTSRFIFVLLFLIVIMAVIYFFYEEEIMAFINEILR